MPCVVGPAPYYKVHTACEHHDLAVSDATQSGFSPPAFAVSHLAQVWQLNSTMLLQAPGGVPMPNIVYTFDFFEPWDYVTTDGHGSASDHGYSYPASYQCGIAFHGWVSQLCPGGSSVAQVSVDKAWLQSLLEAYPLKLAREV